MLPVGVAWSRTFGPPADFVRLAARLDGNEGDGRGAVALVHAALVVDGAAAFAAMLERLLCEEEGYDRRSKWDEAPPLSHTWSVLHLGRTEMAWTCFRWMIDA